MVFSPENSVFIKVLRQEKNVVLDQVVDIYRLEARYV